ncbi:MAG: Ig-like domain-containing protein [Nitrosomonas sp.]|uniref:Ig-like domain-containing protein n=1 Tax=Nitrosomonas sp. TaxID=42353 RepID=UPI002AB8208D|nr:Ig-like domain-containing protein [Nitrosomonas sp.]MDZ4107742.1 Ig-like domain-containing protein [Nitrosomonas sp.]
MTISGDIDTIVGINPLPQVFQVSTGTWRDLTSAQLLLDDYPRMFLAPNGKIFYASASATTRYLDTSGTGAWSFVATRAGGYRDYGSAVMYAPGKILVVGGGSFPPKNTAEVIDLNVVSPSWRAVGSMQYARRQLNATLLPDGTVLVTGGTSAPGFNDATGHVDAAELWNPETEEWTTLASSSGIPRVYHSTALLLPDGRVFSTGGNGHPDVEIYSPPYLFKGARPIITSAPTDAAYGDSFFISTPDAATVSKVTVLRISSVTHGFDMSQVINELSFSQTTEGLNVLAPPSPNVAPPGYYMIFILNENGVPSVAKFVKIGIGSKPVVSVTSPGNDITIAGSSVKISANAIDDIGVSGVQFKLDGANLGAEDTTPPYAITWNSTVVADGTYTITAVARDADGNTTTSAGVSVTVNNTTLLPDVIVTELFYADGIFTSTVMNQGTAATPAGKVIGVGYSVNGNFKTWGDVAGPLAAGASVTIGTKGGSYNIPNGIHTMTADVDDVNRFEELDETNNQLSKPVTGDTIDTIAPTVSISTPTGGSTVAGSSVTISASASDNFGVLGVEFSITGAYPLPEVTTAPYTIIWDSTAVTDGPRTITAVARDAAGNTTTSTAVSITVANGAVTSPTVSITAPSGGSTVTGSSVMISANAADDIGVSGVQFLLDGANLGAEVTTPPYAVTWDSTAVADGPHIITAVARDADGNTTTSAGVSVTVANTMLLPDVIVTSVSYADGIFTSTVTNQGTAATPVGTAIGVGYSVNGNFRTWGAVAGPLAIGASVTIGTNGGPYIIPNGTHTIMADVDDVNRFTESNETNNQLSQPVIVDGGTSPTVSITAPTGGVNVAGSSVTISASAADDIGVSGVQFKLDGTNLGTEVTTPPYAVTWDSTAVPDGPHTITAVARDADGNTTTSAGVSVTVANTTPLPDVIVTSISYADGIFTSTVTNQGTAATPVGKVIGVGYSVNGNFRTWGAVAGPLAVGASVTIGTKGGPYIIPNGTHTIMADVDDVNRFTESNETNNQLSQLVSVP